MTPVLWTAIGVAAGSAVLHAALGLRRPIDRTYLSVACIMAMVAVFLYFQWEFYRAINAEAAVEATRHQLTAVNGLIACMLVFVPAYTRVRLPRSVKAVYWAGLAVVFAANLVAKHCLWYSEQPVLVRSEFRGEPYSNVVAHPMGLPQYAYILYFTSLMAICLVCAVKVFRRGERQRGLTLAVAAGAILVASLVDGVRDSVRASWPYMLQFGVVSWALIMSVQLAHDFRAQADRLGNAIVHVQAQSKTLTAILEAFRALEQNMEGPLQTLESGVAALRARTTDEEDAQLRRLRRAVTRLRSVAHSFPDIRKHVPSSAA